MHKTSWLFVVKNALVLPIVKVTRLKCIIIINLPEAFHLEGLFGKGLFDCNVEEDVKKWSEGNRSP